MLMYDTNFRGKWVKGVRVLLSIIFAYLKLFKNKLLIKNVQLKAMATNNSN